jgi:hypothetical protein
MQKMGIAPSAAPVSSMSKGTYDAIFVGNLTSSHVAALDELFPATNNRVLGCRSRVAQLAAKTPNSVGCCAAFSSVYTIYVISKFKTVY